MRIPATFGTLAALLVVFHAPAALPAGDGPPPPPPPAVTGVLPDGGSVHAGTVHADAGAGGAFRLEGIPAGTRFDLEIRGSVRSHLTGPPKFPLLRDLEMPLSGDLDLGVLHRGGRRLAIRVVDTAGAPIPGADIGLHYGWFRRSWRPGSDPVEAPRRPSYEGRSDAEGKAVLEGVPPGPWNAVVAAAGRATAAVGLNIEREGPDPEQRVILPMARSLRGTVRDGAGRPLPGARVLAANPFPPFLFHIPAATADSEGRFVLERLADGVVDLAILPSPERCVAGGSWLVPSVASADLVVGGAAVVRGVVRDADAGTPIPGAVVRATVQGNEPGSRADGVVLTLADGTFAVAGLPMGRLNSIGAEKPGYAALVDSRSPSTAEGIVATGSPPPRVLRLRRANSAVRGRVFGPDGKPVAGASVRASVEGVAWTETAPFLVRTGEDGAYHLRNLPAGKALVLAAAEGFFQPGSEPPRDVPAAERGRTPPRDRVDVPTDGEATLDIPLVRLGTVAGVVVDPAGKPVPGVRVEGTTADERGWFVLRNVRPWQQFRVTVRDRGWWGSVGPFQVGPGETIPEVRLPVVPAGSVRGVVKGPDGSPVPGARVVLERGPPPAGSPWPDRGGTAFSLPWNAASTDPSGRFLIEGLDPAALAWVAVDSRRPRGGEPVRSPSAHLVVRAPGFPAVAVPVPEDATAEIAIVLPAGRTLEGLVTGPGGRPLGGVRVRVRPMEQDRQNAWRWLLGHPVVAATGADGRFAATGLPAGPWDLLLRAPGFHPRTLAVEEGKAVEAVLDPTVALKGVVTEAATGRALPGCLVTARLLAAEAMDSAVPAAFTGPDGAFEIRGLGPVVHEIRVEPPEDSDLLPFREERSPDGKRTLAVSLKPGLAIAGRVLDAEDRPVARARLEVRPEDPKRQRDVPGFVLSGADGSFRFRGLAEGSYGISIHLARQSREFLRDPWGSEGLEADDLLSDGLKEVPAGTKDAVVRVRRLLPLTGRLVGIGGKPAPLNGRLLLVTDEAGGALRKQPVEILMDGSFRTSPLDPARKWQVWAVNFEGTAGAVVKDVRPGSRDVVVALEAGSTLAGQVLDQEGQPITAGVRVRAEAPEYDQEYPARVAVAEVGKDGRFEIPRLRDIPYRVTVEKTGDVEPVPSKETFFPGRDAPRLRATRFFAAAGRVVDGEGKPVPLDQAMARAPGASGYSARGTGKEDGTFRIERIPFRSAEICVVTRGRSVVLGVYGLPAANLVIPLSAEPAPEPEPEAKKEPKSEGTPRRPRPEPKAPPAPRVTETDPPGTRKLHGTTIRPGPIEGRLTVAGGGVPVGAEVTVFRLDDATRQPAVEPSARVPIDRAGAFKTPDLEAALYEVRARAAGFKPVSEKWPSNTKDRTLTLEQGLSVRGVAVDAATGAPVAGMELRLEPEGPVYGNAWGKTGPDGSFELGFPPPGNYTLILGIGRDRQPWCENPGDALGRRIEKVANGTEGLRVEMTRGLALGGVLRDGEGKALPAEDLKRLLVSFHAGGPEMENLPYPIAGWKQPGPGGEFRFGSLRPGRHTLKVAYSGEPVESSIDFEPVVLDAGPTDLVVRVPFGPPIAGRVVLPEGFPRPRDFRVEVRSVCVNIPGTFSSYLPGITSYKSVWLPVEEDGSFRTGRLDGSKTCDVFVAVRGLITAEIRGVKAGTTGLVLAPKPGAVLEGVVTDETGAPVPAGVAVTAVGMVDQPGDMSNVTAGAPTQEGGRFRIAGLDPRLKYMLRAGGQGTDWLPPRQETVVTVQAGLVVIRVRRGMAASGTVLDAAGNPPPWIQVYAEPLDRGDLSPYYSWWAGTDPKGAFRIGGLPPGKFRLFVQIPGKPKAEFGPFEAIGQEIEIRLPE